MQVHFTGLCDPPPSFMHTFDWFEAECFNSKNFVSGKHSLALQSFNFTQHSTPENPVYECTIAPSGCHSDNDCHYTIGVYCSCYGDTCIRHFSSKTSAGNSRFYALPQRISGWAWQGCDWYFWGSMCYCAREKTMRKSIWPVVWNYRTLSR